MLAPYVPQLNGCVPQSDVSQTIFPQLDNREPSTNKTVDPGEGDVDSSDDDEDFELEPQPIIADPILLATADLLHEGHCDDMESSASSDEE